MAEVKHEMPSPSPGQGVFTHELEGEGVGKVAK